MPLTPFSLAKTAVEACISLPFFLRKNIPSSRQRILMLVAPEYLNFGDLAIAASERSMLAELNYYIVEVPSATHEYWPETVFASIRSDDVLLFTGGGYMGSLWPDFQRYVNEILERFPNNRIIFAPQTVYFGESVQAEHRFIELLGHCADVTFLARDSGTFSWISAYQLPTVRSILVPDAVICGANWSYEGKRSGLLKCFRDDQESVLSSCNTDIAKLVANNLRLQINEASTMIRHVMAPLWMRDVLLSYRLSSFKHAELVITDRLHAMVFAALSNTPVVALDNVSKKVSGAYCWLKDLEYVRVASDYSEVESLAESVYCIPKKARADMLSAWSNEVQTGYKMQFLQAIKDA